MEDFRKTVYASLRESSAKLMPLKMEISKLEDKIESGRYSYDVVRGEMKPKIEKLRRDLDNLGHEAILRAKELVEQQRIDVENAEKLNPAEINDDMKLLNTGLLKRDDIMAILSRNRDNITMTKLVLRYAENHGIEIDQAAKFDLIAAHNGAIAEINETMAALNYYEKWITTPQSVSVLNKFFGVTEEENTED